MRSARSVNAGVRSQLTPPVVHRVMMRFLIGFGTALVSARRTGRGRDSPRRRSTPRRGRSAAGPFSTRASMSSSRSTRAELTIMPWSEKTMTVASGAAVTSSATVRSAVR